MLIADPILGKGQRWGAVGIEASTLCPVAWRLKPTATRHLEPRRIFGHSEIILRSAGRKRYSQNYGTRIALRADADDPSDGDDAVPDRVLDQLCRSPDAEHFHDASSMKFGSPR